MSARENRKAPSSRSSSTSTPLDTLQVPCASHPTVDNRPKRPNPLASDIYFSPVDASRSTVALSSPLTSPRTIPTRASYNLRPSTSVSKATKRTDSARVSPRQLNRVILALLDAAIVQTHVKRHLKGSGQEEYYLTGIGAGSNESEASTAMSSPAPPLTDGSSLRSLRSFVTLSSNETEASVLFADDLSLGIATHAFGEPCKASTESEGSIPSESTLQKLFESMFAKELDVKRAPMAEIRAARLVKSSSKGSVKTVLSNDFNPSTADIIQEEEEGLIALPEGLSLDRSVFETNDSSGGHIVLRIVVQVLRRGSSKKNPLLVIDIDVTESFTKAAIFELLRSAIVDSGFDSRSPALTQGVVDNTLSALSTLSKENCSMQTLTLLSELDRITGQFQEFYILKATEMHSTGHPARLTIPWVSYSMETLLSEDDGQDLREILVGIVGKKSVGGKVFSAKLEWDGNDKRIHGVPLFEDGQESPLTWVCFARDGYDIGYW